MEIFLQSLKDWQIFFSTVALTLATHALQKRDRNQKRRPGGAPGRRERPAPAVAGVENLCDFDANDLQKCAQTQKPGEEFSRNRGADKETLNLITFLRNQEV